MMSRNFEVNLVKVPKDSGRRQIEKTGMKTILTKLLNICAYCPQR
jgi:hypothetical protein